jgi:hypothetical protein
VLLFEDEDENFEDEDDSQMNVIVLEATCTEPVTFSANTRPGFSPGP